jgi:hypothetical protein
VTDFLNPVLQAFCPWIWAKEERTQFFSRHPQMKRLSISDQWALAWRFRALPEHNLGFGLLNRKKKL